MPPEVSLLRGRGPRVARDVSSWWRLLVAAASLAAALESRARSGLLPRACTGYPRSTTGAGRHPRGRARRARRRREAAQAMQGSPGFSRLWITQQEWAAGAGGRPRGRRRGQRKSGRARADPGPGRGDQGLPGRMSWVLPFDQRKRGVVRRRRARWPRRSGARRVAGRPRGGTAGDDPGLDPPRVVSGRGRPTGRRGPGQHPLKPGAATAAGPDTAQLARFARPGAGRRADHSWALKSDPSPSADHKAREQPTGSPTRLAS